MTISLEEHVARAIQERRVKPDFGAKVTLADGSKQWVIDHDTELARAAIAAVREHEGVSQMVCGCCGQPWTDEMSCAQKDNGWDFRTCYPSVAPPGTLSAAAAPDPAEAMRAKRSNGFTEQDYSYLAERIRMDADKPYLSAILSNNFNVILGALDTAAALKGNGEGV